MAKTITYTINLTITRAIRVEDLDPSYPMADHIDAMTDQKAKTELEKEVIQALRKLDGDCDCEVMETAVSEDDEPEPVDEAYERAAARDRADGFARTGGKDWT